MTRQELFTWIRQQYGTEPEYLWHDWNAVLRHNDNNKWYGVVLEVSADKLELPEAGIIDVLNVKSDPLLIGSLRGQDGYFPAYCRHNSIIVFEDTQRTCADQMQGLRTRNRLQCFGDEKITEIAALLFVFEWLR